MWHNRELTDDQMFERGVMYLKAAQKLGCKYIRLCHAPTSIENPIQQSYLEPADRLGMPFIGLQSDFSSYEYCMSTADIEYCVHYGCTREVLEHLRDKQREAYFSGKTFNFDEVKGKFGGMGLNEHDKDYLDYTKPSYPESPKFFHSAGSVKKLKELASKLVYCHGKFYDIDKDGQVDS